MKTVIIAKVEYEYIEGEFASGNQIKIIAYYQEGLKYKVEWLLKSRVEMIEGLLGGPLEKGVPVKFN